MKKNDVKAPNMVKVRFYREDAPKVTVDFEFEWSRRSLGVHEEEAILKLARNAPSDDEFVLIAEISGYKTARLVREVYLEWVPQMDIRIPDVDDDGGER